MGETKRNILVVYSYRYYPMRATIKEHLYSFLNYCDDNVYYLNLTFKTVPNYIRTVKFDLIIFHTLFLSNHWGGPNFFRSLLDKASSLKEMPAIKVALPQDEFIHSALYSQFINEFGIDCVFSVAPEQLWPQLYQGVDFRRVRFYRILTGYLDERKIAEYSEAGRKMTGRKIDIGYRTAGRPYFWFGRHGFLKQRIADLFLAESSRQNLQADISTDGADAILGDAWYRFLLDCKYTIGVEGGTSLVDPDGTIAEKVAAYVADRPEAEFEEVEATCFPGLDGTGELFALSPRHLEACLTGTCQILTSGEYNGILKAGDHYIELKKDFSNIGEVIGIVKEDALRAQIAEKAYCDIIKSGLYTYRNFVRFVVGESLGDGYQPLDDTSSARVAAVFWLTKLAECLEWSLIALLSFVPSGLRKSVKKVRHLF